VSCHCLAGIFGQRAKLRAEVSIMKESIFLVPYVDEGGIEAGHDLPDPAEIDITYVKVIARFLLMEFYQLSIFEQSDLHT
jgi:hypothetical protein